MSEVKVTFRCDGCESTISFPASEAGMVRDCPECGGWVDVPEVTRRSIHEAPETWGRLQEELNHRYMEEAFRLQRANARQSEASDRQQERDASYTARREQLVDRADQLMSRFEKIALSLETILAKWQDRP